MSQISDTDLRRARVANRHRDVRPQTEDVARKKGQTFELTKDYCLRRELLLGIYECGFEYPSPVQEETIPMAITGKHIIARAKNGTGKTAAFLIPILEGIDASKNSVQAIIMTNTRELVLQIAAEAKKLAAHMKGVQIMSTIGGMTYREDIVRLRGTVHILVGTPGRVVDMLVDKRVSSLKDCKVLALDEADKMLEDNFLEDTERVIDELPADRQLMLFSATYPASVKEFRDRHMPAEHRHDANLMEELTLKGVTQYYAFVDERQKVQCLQTLFSRIQVNQCMIFCASAKRVALLSRKITELGFSCLFIHAHMDQADRNRVFHDFREGAVRNLVCTDVFARGIDNQAVNVVINFDFPGAPQTYLNRIGRSGRYGHRGVAISFISEADKYNMYVIERELNTTISVIPDEIPAELYATDTSVEAEGF